MINILGPHVVFGLDLAPRVVMVDPNYLFVVSDVKIFNTKEHVDNMFSLISQGERESNKVHHY